ncbi:hypothetical protein DFJ73DRAFT_811095 [Zopfochytrium polystomum]|nr:hypothetical protein DFJ73DRAFT_811095 [Zopfochytrium polystomum]
MSSNAAVKAVEASARKVHSVMGIVVGTHMAKTIKVRTAKSRMHPVVLKPVVKHKNILAHDETESCVVGDWVRIDSCRQISKTKRYTLGDIVRPAARYVDEFGVMHSQAAPVPKPTPPRKIDNLFGTGKQ